jgi:hypothetical protein
MYLYLGVPALFGIPWLVKRPDRSVVAVLIVSALFLKVPFGIIMMLVYRSGLLAQVFSNFSFIEPATLAYAFAAANGIDAYLKPAKTTSPQPPALKWFACCSTMLLLVAWPAYRLLAWPRSAPRWNSAMDTFITLLIFIAGLSLVRRGWCRIAFLIYIFIFVDYKVVGTGHPFSSLPGDLDPGYPRAGFPGVSSQAFDAMRDHGDYRVAVDGVHATDLRRYGLASPQGFEPLLPSQYKSFIEQFQPFRTNRIFEVAPANKEMLRNLGVRYFLTHDTGRFQADVARDPDFRQVGEPSSFFKVYEYIRATPAWRWDGGGDARKRQWRPEVREFFVNARTTGRLILLEQFYPGWFASIDGKSAKLDRFQQVFQSVTVPDGNHIVRFEYRPLSLRIGAMISALALIGMGIVLWKDRNREAAVKD